jgi:alpha-glucosidase
VVAHAVCYQVYVRSFADSDGDGVGDLPGITARLPYLRDLGVDALWITPFYTSPQQRPRLRRRRLPRRRPAVRHARRRRRDARDRARARPPVIVDLVPNHTSSEHAWFQAALAAGRAAPSAAATSSARGGPTAASTEQLDSVFGGPAWTGSGRRVVPPPLRHHPARPRLAQPRGPAMFEDVLRFWLDRGVDGFRIDVAHGLFKEDGLRDQVARAEERAARPGTSPMITQRASRRADVGPARGARGLPALARGPRRVRRRPDGRRRGLDPDPESMAALRPARRAAAGVQLPLARRAVVGRGVRDVIEQTLAAAEVSPPDLGARQPRRGPARSRGTAAASRPARWPGRDADDAGAAGVGVPLPGRGARPRAGRRPAELRQDPSWFRTGATGRDGCRVPIPWSGDEAAVRLRPGRRPALAAAAEEWADLSVEAQDRRRGLRPRVRTPRARRPPRLPAASDGRSLSSRSRCCSARAARRTRRGPRSTSRRSSP